MSGATERDRAARLLREVRAARAGGDELSRLLEPRTEPRELAPVPRSVPRPATVRAEPRELAPVTRSVPPPVAFTRSPAVSLPRPRKYTAGGLVLGAGLLVGAYLLVTRKRAAASPAPSSPNSPSTPPPAAPTSPALPTTPPPAPIPTTPATPEPPPLVPHWSPDGKTLNRLEGHHRATKKEVGPEAVKVLPELLKAHPIGSLVPFEADGKRYVAAFETHDWFGADLSKPPKPHKGISLFLPDAVKP